ncbi:MAG TPA: right-handed parallel beta-helix repeat-containing protein [Pyrinomonadaceae bacterium]|jgi:hypothetical protein
MTGTLGRATATLLLGLLCAAAAAAQPAAPARVTEANAAAYPSFGAAVDAVAAAGGALVVSTSQTLTADKTVPAGVHLRFEPGGTLSAQRPVTVTLHEPPVAGRWQLFGENVTVKFAPRAPDVLFPEWWGARGDNTTDDYPAFRRALDSMKGASPHLQLAAGRTYHLSQTLDVDFHLLLDSTGGADNWYQPAALSWPADTTGLRVHSNQTRDGPAGGGNDDAHYTTIRNLYLQGGGQGASAGNCSVSGLTVTRLTGANFDGQAGWLSGNVVDIGGVPYVLATDAADASHVSLRPVKTFVVTAATGEATLYRGNYDNFSPDWVGATITLYYADADGVRKTQTRTITAANASQLTLNAKTDPMPPVNGATWSGDAEITNLNIRSAPYKPAFHHGIDARATVNVEHTKVWGFNGSGLFLNSVQVGKSSIPQTSPNTNVSLVVRNSFYNNYGHGIFARGLNSNQSLFENNDTTNNRGAGIAELSFLGNNYLSNHTSFNWRGARLATNGGVNTSNTFGEYDEGGQPSAEVDQNHLNVGGNRAAGLSPGGGYIGVGSGRLFFSQSLFASSNGVPGATKTTGLIFSYGQPNTLFAFGAAEAAANRAAGAPRSTLIAPSYLFGYDQLRPGWFSLYFGGNYASHQANSVFALSEDPAAEGGGKLWLYRGVDFIGPNRAAGLAPDGDGVLKLTGGARAGGATLYSPLKTDAYSPSLTLDFAEGNVHTVTLKGDVTTLRLANLRAGGEYVVRVVQDGVGGRSVAWTNVRWAGGQAPRLSTGPNQVDIFRFVSPDAVVLEEVSRALGVR